MNSRRLDIIIPIYKNADLAEACVRSLLAHLPEIADRSPRIILINDSPEDSEVNAMLSKCEDGSSDLIVIHNKQNIGFVRSVNQGLAYAEQHGRDALLVNSDTQTFAGTLVNLMAAASADPQIGFASPRSNNASICSLPHVVDEPATTPHEAHRRWSEICRALPAFHFSPTVVGFYMFISHKVLAGHGSLREDFGLGYEEENDLVMRAGKVGIRAVIANHSFAYHAGSASFGLLDLDLKSHKEQNLQKLAQFHPEFLPLVRRYEDSPHYRAERMLSGLLNDSEGRLKLAFDLTGMGQHHNGTNEQAVAVLNSLAKRQGHRIRLAGVCSEASFRFHGLDKVSGLRRVDPEMPGLHGVAVRMAQPFDLHHLNVLESLAPVNVFAMLDTIAEDCGPLALDQGFLELWDHAAEHANGLLFISQFSEQTFCNRHPAARALPRWTRLLPTRLSSYPKGMPSSAAGHVFVLGNHFAHKGSDVAARAIASAFPSINVVALGSTTVRSNNLTSFRPGLIEQAQIERLFRSASVVVLPSHEEGFGLGFMHALAAGRPIVARRIPATEEILARLDDVEGVFLFDHDADLMSTLTRALQSTRSSAHDDRGLSWDDWSDELTDFCISLTQRDDLFDSLVRRIAAGDRLRRAWRGDALFRQAQQEATAPEAERLKVPNGAEAVDLQTLLTLEGEAFVEHAYATLLLRPADSSGLRFYVSELARGIAKVEILRVLANSPEGRARNAKLEGLEALIHQQRKARIPLFNRIFNTHSE